MTFLNPLSELPGDDDAADLERVQRARAGPRGKARGSGGARRAAPGLDYNIVRRMTYNPADAEDATQEILIKLITRLASFEYRVRVTPRV